MCFFISKLNRYSSGSNYCLNFEEVMSINNISVTSMIYEKSYNFFW